MKINILSSDKAGIQLSVEQMLCFSAGYKEKRCASHALRAVPIWVGHSHSALLPS